MNEAMDKAPTHLDLFSGIGGFAVAAQWAGFRTIGFCEIDPYCQKVLAKNFLADTESQRSESGCLRQRGICESGNNVYESSNGSATRPIIRTNIFDLDGRDFAGVSLITGGFPCQPFSVAGKRRGAGDDRAIWPEMFRVISEARPAWVLGENVPGIIPMELDNVLSDLEGIGYAARPFNIGAVSVNARHRRQRVWIIGRNMVYSTEQRDCRICDNGDSGQHRESQRKSGGNSICSPLSNTSSEGLERQRQQPGGIGSQLDDAGDYCRWLPEPDVCGMVDGLPEGMDGGLNAGQRMDSEISSFTDENTMRNVWRLVAAKSSSQGQQSLKQLSIELADAVCQVSHNTSLAERKKGEACSFAFLCRLRQACETLGVVRNPSDSLPEIWQSMSCEETGWAAHVAFGAGCFHSEWPNTTRVAHGIPSRVDRLKGLGNAIVPQVAYEILREIRKLI